MFLSLKRKFSSAILNALILLAFLIFCYLGKQVSYRTTQENVNNWCCGSGVWPLPAVPEGRPAADLPDRAGGAPRQHRQTPVGGQGRGRGLPAGQLCYSQQSWHQLETWQMKEREIVYLEFVIPYLSICRKLKSNVESFWVYIYLILNHSRLWHTSQKLNLAIMPNVISKPSLTKETFIVGSIALGLVGAAAGLYFLHKDADNYDLVNWKW